MKLEAVDRKNPSLVCVATIADIVEDRLLVHFDNWDDIYDYWWDTIVCFIFVCLCFVLRISFYSIIVAVLTVFDVMNNRNSLPHKLLNLSPSNVSFIPREVAWWGPIQNNMTSSGHFAVFCLVFKGSIFVKRKIRTCNIFFLENVELTLSYFSKERFREDGVNYLKACGSREDATVPLN